VDYYLDTALRKAGKERANACLEDTCLYGTDMEDFLHDMTLLVELCRKNRQHMTEFITSRMGWHITDYTDICHHIIDQNDGVIRHGAIAAGPGQKVVIPINAREGCLLGTGKGNPEWNQSAPHGAGRRMSRREARQKLDMETYRAAMKDVYTSSVNSDNLDEAPAAYKPMESILSAVRDSVEIERILRPVYNYKG
jgi:RNA-splicing ligase RtcB